MKFMSEDTLSVFVFLNQNKVSNNINNGIAHKIGAVKVISDQHNKKDGPIPIF